MADIRAQQLAELVLDYSIGLKKKDRLLVQFEPSYKYYADIVSDLAEKKGAQVRYDPVSFDSNHQRHLIERANPQEWKSELERRVSLARWCNTRVLVCTAEAITNADFDKEVIGPYKKVLYRPGKNNSFNVRWNIVGFPSRGKAKESGMSFKEYENFVYRVTLGNNWQDMSGQMQRIKSVFDGAKEVRVIVPNLTDLSFSLYNKKEPRKKLRARGGEICDGKLNMPDGEIFYGPVEHSVEGFVNFQHPTKRGDKILEGIRLELQNGRVIKSSARTNERELKEYIDIADGTGRFGEFGIGCNYAIQKPILDTLFDEKIGGTVHFALGNSCSEDLLNGGGLIPRGIPHWDIVCDLRRDEKDLANFPGGEIWVDGKIIQEKGVWKI